MAVEFSPEQLRVIQSRNHNLLVSAAAGAGKTAVLVERILSLIMDPEKPVDLDRILIVTFTVAAAGEMRDRIGSAIEKRLEQEPDNERLRRQSVLVHSAQISTIDSFCSYIIRNYFYRIDMDPAFRTMEDGEKSLLFDDTLRKLIEERYEEGSEDYRFLSTNYFYKKSDDSLEDIVERMYNAAITEPWPLEWLEKVRAAYSDEAVEAMEDPEEKAQTQWCAPAIRALTALTEDLIARYDAAKRRRGVCDFADLEHLALQILYEEDENGKHVRSGAAKELADHFACIMTDEYQDSNLIQEAILSAVSGNEDDVFNRFMVGDIKQSIYGFRQARPDLFLDKFIRYGNGEKGSERIDLSANYRSRKEVIDAVNQVFSRLMIPELGGIVYDDTAALRYGGLYGEEDPADYTAELILVDQKSPDMAEYSSTGGGRHVEAALAAQRIREIVGKLPVYDKEEKITRPCRYSDIAILLQTQKGVGDIFVQELTDRGIPVHAISKEGYFSATEVAAVLNYLAVLDNPRQDIPLAAVLFSPIGGLSAQEAAQIRIGSKESSYYDACCAYAENGDDAELKAKLSAFLSNVEELRPMARYAPVHELIRTVFARTGYREIAASMPGGAVRAANLDMLVEKARSFEESSYHGLFQFNRYMERLKKYELDEGEAGLFSDTADTVRVMTIHKSKGLEFPVVFLCDAAHSFNITDTYGDFLFHSELGAGIVISDVEKHRKVKGMVRERIAQRKKEEIYAENVRLLYVAMTRAREKLYITAAVKDLEKLQKQAEELRKNPEEPLTKKVLMENGSFAKWLVLALHGLEKPCIRTRIETKISLDDKLEQQESKEESVLKRLREAAPDTVFDPAVRSELEAIRSFSYPYQVPEGIPGKMTVTQLKYLTDEMSEEEQGEVFEKEPVVVPYLPSFARETKKEEIRGAAKGTLYHKVFERLDYSRLDGQNDGETVRRLIAELQEKGTFTEAEAAAVRPEEITAFLASPVGVRMKRAALRGQLWREQAFTFSIPASMASSDWPEGEELLAQGIIDAFFLEDGEYVIVDYKTDYVPDGGASLVDKYGKQVYYYAKALEAATGGKVKEKIIYSTVLGRGLTVE